MTEFFALTLPALFTAVLVMSLTASLAALAVLPARALLKALGLPRLFCFLLWAVVLLRMVCPVTFESRWSLLSLVPDRAPSEVASELSATPRTVPAVLRPAPHASGSDDAAAPPSAPDAVPRPETAPSSSAPRPGPPAALPVLWLAGVLALCLWALLSYLRLKRRVRAAVWTEGALWVTDRIEAPFVLGFFPPKIYLPPNLPEDTAHFVVLHERAHIRRGDHIVKAFSFLALALHWFNPLLWFCWVLACRDMEAACDEKVLKDHPMDSRRRYSAALLSLASMNPVRVPLAFGENDVKERIRQALRWRRPAAAVLSLALLLSAALGWALSADPVPLPDAAPALTRETSDAPALSAAVDAETWAQAPRFTPPGTAFHLFFRGDSPDEVSALCYPPGELPRSVVTEHQGASPVVFFTLPDDFNPSAGDWGLSVTAAWRSGVNRVEHTYTFRLSPDAETTYPEWWAEPQTSSSGEDLGSVPMLRYPGEREGVPVLPLLPLPAEWGTDRHAPAVDGVQSMAELYCSGFDMGFTSPQEGWLVLRGGAAMGSAWNYVYLTHDGGHTWTETGNVNAECHEVLNCAAFTTPEIGFLCFRYEWGDAPIYRTTDGGRTWERFELPLPVRGDTVYEVDSIALDGLNVILHLTRHAFNGDGSRMDTGMTYALGDYGTSWGLAEGPVFDAPLDPYSLKPSDLPYGPARSTKNAGYQENQPVRLLAELPDESVGLYALNEYWLGVGGVLLVRDRDMSTARWYPMEHSVLTQWASLRLADYDGDGAGELAADFCTGTGTGVNMQELAVFELDGRGFGVRHSFDEAVFRPLALAALKELGVERYDQFGMWVDYEFDGDTIRMTMAVQDDATPPGIWSGGLLAAVEYDGAGFTLADCSYSEEF